jgi:pSer/pThr/pTyr-binding forkhead associated (FHA) protein
MAIRFVIKQNGSGKAAQDDPAIAEYVFDENLFTIGSDAANHLILEESAVEQAVIVREEEFLTLINRAEGTSLNGKKLPREAFQPLDDGDRIEIGSYVIFVADSESTAPIDAPPDEPTAAEEPPADPPADAEIPKPDEPLALDENPPENKHITAREKKPPPPEAARNFAAILDTLRTEEDSFYFIVENKAHKELRRIRLEQAEMPLGTTQRGEIAGAAEEIQTFYAVARKDWNGILLEASKPNAIFVNGEAVAGARRLRNEDRVSFSPQAKQTLVLHEPSSLVALESMLTSRVGGEARFGIHKTNAPEEIGAVSTSATAEKNRGSLFERTFFGHFSFLEVVTMFFATLIGAVLVFLFLEFMFT